MWDLATPVANTGAPATMPGRDFVEELARACGASLQEESRFFGLTGRVTLSGHDVRLLIPTTFMNLSGKAVAATAGFFKIAPEQILVASR